MKQERKFGVPPDLPFTQVTVEHDESLTNYIERKEKEMFDYFFGEDSPIGNQRKDLKFQDYFAVKRTFFGIWENQWRESKVKRN